MKDAISLEISNILKEKYSSLDREDAMNIISSCLEKYEVKEKEVSADTRSDLNEKAYLFCLDKKINGLSKNTIKNYKSSLDKFCSSINKNVQDITSNDIRIFISEYSSNNDAKHSTISNMIGVLKRFFGWLFNEGYLDKDPSKTIRQVKVKKTLRRSLDDKEIELLRDACVNYRDRALLEFMISSGCRLNEASQLDADKINWSNMSAVVIGKGNKERTIRFNSRAKYHMLKYLHSRPNNDDKQPLFTNSKRPYNRLSNRAIQKEFEKMVKRAGMQKGICLHMTRHTTASKMIRSGASIITVQRTLGHADPNTTMGYITQDSNAINYEYDKYMQ